MMLPTIILRIERWKFNKDYGVYVSTQGNFKDRYKRRLPIRINQKGYCMVKTESGFVLSHRLVMFTWRPIPNAENLTVDHLNHNKRDNSVENLEWVTRAENQRRARIDYVHVDENGEEKVRAEKTASISNLTLAKTHYFKNLTTGATFSDGFEAATWARENAKVTSGSIDNSVKKLVAACKKNDKWYDMEWQMIPKEEGEY